ncbi:MAG TPA: gluconate 2-dehydrogenase subunit 3 family protein [Eudoraea sp.]|nr:gluconate 2-dehydrogenase subunit 3 family protein [Eudoraea sp.]
MAEVNLWSRRKFSKAVISLQALVAAGALNIPIACSTKEGRRGGKILSPSLEKLLQLAMDEIIPCTDKMPAASEVQGVQYIFGVLEEYPDLIDGFIQILSELEQQSETSERDSFKNLNRDSRITVLKQYENKKPDNFSVLVNFVYEGYYINEKVWELIGYEPYTTLSAGPEMKPFNEQLLDRVKQTPALYKKA